MRLKTSTASADEQLIALINRGYAALAETKTDYGTKKAASTYVPTSDNKLYGDKLNEWATEVVEALKQIFPTELEINQFLNPENPFGAVSGDYEYECLVRRFLYFVKGLDELRQKSLARYTDLPLATRIFVEDIDSFRKVRDVNPATVGDLLNEHGYFDRSEDSIQMALEQILSVSMHKKDWGGEINDLYTANVILNGNRIATAFLLKGNGLRKRTMEIADCGSNGDQIVRLMRSPARMFVIQFVGQISEAVIEDIEGKVKNLRSNGQDAVFCIMDGQDTARVLHAYGKS